ncbi:MAG: class I SAM-dependent methyltransferase [Myxococcaceae bacterium]|nr:class I SAM-dependent methyltransferase [Myxococcaceae bacterium]
MAPRLPPRARVLSLAEGEGRNAVYLASLGHHVTAVDASRVGLEKAQRLAAERGVVLETVVSDLSDFPIAPSAWDAAILVFCHLPSPLRRRVHRALVDGLRPGGVVLLEAYTPAQLGFRTGGPPVAELLYTAEELRADFMGLELPVLREIEREVVEGSLHTGRAAVVQLVGRKPS